MNSGQGEEKPPALGLEEGKGRHTGELQPFTPSKGVQRAGGLQQDSPHRLGSEKGNTGFVHKNLRLRYGALLPPQQTQQSARYDSVRNHTPTSWWGIAGANSPEPTSPGRTAPTWN